MCFSPRAACALPPCGLAFVAIVAHAHALAFPSNPRAKTSAASWGWAWSATWYRSAPGTRAHKTCFACGRAAGGKRHAPGAQSSAGSSASDAKKAKVMPSYVFTSAMKPTDEFAAPLWARPHRFRRFTTRSRCFLVQGRPCALSERGEGAARGWASGGLLPLLGAADLTRRGVALLPNRGRQCLEAPAMSVLPSANAQASYSAMVVAARADSRSLFARAGRAFAS